MQNIRKILVGFGCSYCVIFFLVLQGGSEFVIKEPVLQKSMSRNRLKGEIGNIMQQAFNSTTELGRIVGNVKISFANKLITFFRMRNSKDSYELSKNDGLMQVELSTIQRNFSDMISDLVKNRGFFKKASRNDLKDFFELIQGVHKNLNSQIMSFNSVLKIKDEKLVLAGIRRQFRLTVIELKEICNKIQRSKYVKKI